MELRKNIKGYRLTKIEKLVNENKLIFEKKNTRERLVIYFKGLLFETHSSALNKRVVRVELRSVLGFKAISQLRQMNIQPEKYKQLLIQMEGSTDEIKTELICVFEKYRTRKFSSR